MLGEFRITFHECPYDWGPQFACKYLSIQVWVEHKDLYEASIGGV